MSLHLYYDSKKGLVKKDNYACGCYIQEHDEKGWETPLHEQTLVIPNSNVKIVAHTNLHFGPKSYMYATISVMDKVVLNFHDTTLCHSVSNVYAKPGDWNALFDGIIQLYYSIYNSENPINTYFDAIDEIINNTTGISVEKTINVTNRLAEISDNLQKSIYSDNKIVVMRMKRACKILVRNVINNGIKGSVTELRHNTIEKNLHSIFRYLAERDEMLDVLARKNQFIVVNEK